jgi:hypothetical protein
MYTFDILLESDFEGLDDRRITYIHNSIIHNNQIAECNDINSYILLRKKFEGENDWMEEINDEVNSAFETFKSKSGEIVPIFRVVALDDCNKPLFSKSIKALFNIIFWESKICSQNIDNLNESKYKNKCVNRRDMESFNLNAHQFFGIGLPFVRKAIEFIPESSSTMFHTSLINSEKSNILYLPSYKIPSLEDFSRIKKLKYQNVSGCNNFNGTISINGCSRADSFKSLNSNNELHSQSRKVLSRILAKAVDDPSDRIKGFSENDNEFNEDNVLNDEDELNLRDSEYNRVKYIAMSEAYLRNPNAKLEVRKSRIHGWGLFARINFEKNDIIVEYIGQKIRQVIADRREQKYEDEGVGSCYLFRYCFHLFLFEKI